MSAVSSDASREAPASTSETLSVAAERQVAERFMGRIEWESAGVGLGQASVWFANWALVLSGAYPLGLGFCIALLCCCLAYLPSHEGQHGNISGGRPNLRWLDSLVGHISVIPLAMSHEVLRVTHMKHHAYTNDPERDVDINSSGKHWWQAAISVHRGIPKSILRLHAERDRSFAAALLRGVPLIKAFHLIELALVVLFPLETLLLWWLPRKLAVSYLAIFFSWFPHHLLAHRGRYADTRFWQNRIPRFLCQSMQTHVLHHLYPRIPHWDEPSAIDALKPFMIERGVPGAKEIPERVRFNPLIERK